MSRPWPLECARSFHRSGKSESDIKVEETTSNPLSPSAPPPDHNLRLLKRDDKSLGGTPVLAEAYRHNAIMTGYPFGALYQPNLMIGRPHFGCFEVLGGDLEQGRVEGKAG